VTPDRLDGEPDERPGPPHPLALIRASVLRWSNDCAEAEHMGQAGGPCPLDVADVLQLLDAMDQARAECAALTDALTAVSHEYQASDINSTVTGEPACGNEDIYDELCLLHPSHRVHRTPVRVRAELDPS
jgi:hypothetical protein